MRDLVRERASEEYPPPDRNGADQVTWVGGGAMERIGEGRKKIVVQSQDFIKKKKVHVGSRVLVPLSTAGAAGAAGTAGTAGLVAFGQQPGGLRVVGHFFQGVHFGRPHLEPSILEKKTV